MSHQWSVRVRTDSTPEITATARNHSWRLGEPISFSDKDPLPTSLEIAVSALAADVIGTLRRLCKLRRIEFDQAELAFNIHLENPLTYIGVVGEEGSPAIERIQGVLYVSSGDEDEVQATWPDALARSPLYQTLTKAAALDLRLVVTP